MVCTTIGTLAAPSEPQLRQWEIDLHVPMRGSSITKSQRAVGRLHPRGPDVVMTSGMTGSVCSVRYRLLGLDPIGQGRGGVDLGLIADRLLSKTEALFPRP
jgi:hypothetical protein